MKNVFLMGLLLISLNVAAQDDRGDAAKTRQYSGGRDEQDLQLQTQLVVPPRTMDTPPNGAKVTTQEESDEDEG